MPTVNVLRDQLFQRLGQVFTDDEFADLCFNFGLELDDVTTEKQMISKEQGVEKADASDDVIYRIEVPANRYDLLCLEGLVRGILVFLGKMTPPTFTVVPGSRSVIVQSSTQQVRPYVVAAVLRGVTLNESSYKSFIDLQDKLHQNVCRQRTLVSIGTHDLDEVSDGPIIYDARDPEDIKFVALKQTQEMTAAELMKLYATDGKLKAFLHILQDKPVYPVILDAKGTVLSFPPIINSEKTKIKLSTKNIFIEITATDHTKASLVLDNLVAMFSEYCDDKFSVESVTVAYPDGSSHVFPKLAVREERVTIEKINQLLGTALTTEEVVQLLAKMGLKSEAKASDLTVYIPPTRHDMLHAVDVIEDVGIAFGYNNIPERFPKVVTVGRQLLMNSVCDQLRGELARCGFTEVMTFALCSRNDMERISRSEGLVTIANPKTIDTQVLRSSLIAGLLKTAQANKKMPLPLKLFEVSDVVVLDSSTDVGARNQRKLAVMHLSKTPGFEVVHGILDRIMKVMGVAFEATGYQISPHKDPAFFDGRCALITLAGESIGTMGAVHPDVLFGFGLSMPSAVLEISVEPLVQDYLKREKRE